MYTHNTYNVCVHTHTQVWIGGTVDPVGEMSLVSSFSVSQRENFSVSQCLNGGAFMYTFGHDPASSMFSLGVTSFFKPCGDGAGRGALSTAVAAYKAGRVSQNRAVSTLSVGDATLRGFLVAQNIEAVSAEIGALVTNYTFAALDPQGQEEP